MKRLNVWAFGLCYLFFGAGILSAQETTENTATAEPIYFAKEVKKKKKVLSPEEVLRREQIAAKIQKEKEESLNKVKITKYTVMSNFEPDLVISSEEREEKKQQRIVKTYRKKELLDTMDISDRKRKRLMKDLRKTPFSNRLSKATVIVETEFQDDDIQQDK